MNRHHPAPAQPSHPPGWLSSMDSVSAQQLQEDQTLRPSEAVTLRVFCVIAIVMTTWVWAGLSLKDLLGLLTR